MKSFEAQSLLTAICCRVSTSDQTCEAQLKELREYVARLGWTIAGEYIDAGFSGANASRPALDSLMKAATLRKFDCVAVYKLDRFGRSVLHLNQQIETLTRNGVRFFAVSQGLDADRSNPTSRLPLQILASVAGFEREMIRERTLSGICAAQSAGIHVGRPKGISRRDEVVRLRDEQGLPWRAIAAKLDIPAMTAVVAYKTFNTENGTCTKTAAPKKAAAPSKDGAASVPEKTSILHRFWTVLRRKCGDFSAAIR